VEPTAPGETPTQEKEQAPADSVQLRVSRDKMVVTLSSPLPSDRHEELESILVPELKRIGVLEETAHRQALHAFREATEKGEPLTDVPILKGTPPIPGADAKLSWTGDFFAKGFVIDQETGAIDFRERLAEDTVQKGDHLADYQPPTVGKDGITVFGQRVSAANGQAIKIKAGTGVRVEGDKYFADADGRIRFANDVLTVDHVLAIEGSVGLETGNINHPGALVVKQNIEAETKVVATGSIEVAGYVEGADIVAGGDLIVKGGIIGEPGRKIRAKGEVHARFLKNADIEAHGDVVAVNGIEQCTVKTRGAILVPQGRIVGGKVSALMGIDAGDIGSEACVKTIVATGEDYLLSQLLEECHVELSTLKTNLAKVEAAIAPHIKDEDALSPGARKKYDLLKKQALEMYRRIDSLETDLETLPEESRTKAKYEILVRKRLFPATSATIGRVTKLINEEAAGPVAIAIMRGDVRVVTKTLRKAK